MITLFIPTYRRPHTLKKAIASALNQTYKNLQVIVCDNASGDETQDIIHTFAEKDPRLHSICHKKNLGMLGNYQYMLSSINTEFFSFLSDDDVLLPHFCETAMHGFSQFPDIAFFAASTVVINEERKIIRIPLEEWSREGLFLPEEGLSEMIGKYLVPMTVLCRKTAEIDLENPSGWDCDFFIQLAARYPFAVSKKICGIYWSHPNSFTVSQSTKTNIDSIERLMARVESFPWMTPEMKIQTTRLLQTDRYNVSLRLILKNLVQNKSTDAKILSLRLLKGYPVRWKALLFFILTTTCCCFPFFIPLLLLLKKMKTFLRGKKFARKQLQDYTQMISEDHSITRKL